MAIKSDGKILTARQQKAKVLEWTGWTTEKYNKEYDKLRNKVRAYEKATSAAKGSINVADLLAREVRGQFFAKRYGEEHKQTELYTAIQATPSISSGRNLSAKRAELVRSAGFESVDRQFSGVITKSKYSQDIIKEVTTALNEGKLTAAKYREIVEKYARMLGSERENISAINAASPDPYKKYVFTST